MSNTGGWQNWQTITGSIILDAGVQEMTLEFVGGVGGLMNVNWMKFDFNPGLYCQLVDANTDMVIRNFLEEDTIDLTIDGTDLNIVAVLNNPAGSVQFGLDSNPNYRIKNVAPYALQGDMNGDFFSWTPTIGMHTVTASAYQNPSAAGTLLVSETVNFVVIESCGGAFVDSNLNGISDICETECQPSYVLSGSYPSTSVLEFEAQNNIQSTSVNLRGANIIYNAGSAIEMQAGFEIQSTATFHAFIAGCTP